MKKLLKGMVVVSLFNIQVLVAPISVLAVTDETTESSEMVAPQNTEEQVGEVVNPKPIEENKVDSAATETPDRDTSANNIVEESQKVDAVSVPEGKEEKALKQSGEQIEKKEMSKASEVQKQRVRAALAKAQSKLDKGTYTAESIAELRVIMEEAEKLLADPSVIDSWLSDVIKQLNKKVNSLVSAPVELSFAKNLEIAIDEATKIINNTDEFKNLYTPASVEAKKARIQDAVDAGEIVLLDILQADGTINPRLAVANRVNVVNAANDIYAAINDGNGLIRRDHLAEIIEEASKLSGSKVANAKDKVDFENAFHQAVDAFDNALTNKEADDAVKALRDVMDRLRLLVVVSLVDENNHLIMDQAATSLTGRPNVAWSVEPPVIEGYEYVSSNNQPLTYTSVVEPILSGTFGDGTNDVTFVYKQIGVEKPILPIRPVDPEVVLQKPATINLTNHNQKNTYKSNEKLPQTGEQTSVVASLGFIVLAVGTLLFFKPRKIKE